MIFTIISNNTLSLWEGESLNSIKAGKVKTIFKSCYLVRKRSLWERIFKGGFRKKIELIPLTGGETVQIPKWQP